MEKRKNDKLNRRQKKVELYFESERDIMISEDDRSYKLRHYNWECERIIRERENMFNEEREQTDVDRFWGLDLYELNLNNEEKRLRILYYQRVEELNKVLMKTKAIKNIDFILSLDVKGLRNELIKGTFTSTDLVNLFGHRC